MSGLLVSIDYRVGRVQKSKILDYAINGWSLIIIIATKRFKEGYRATLDQS